MRPRLCLAVAAACGDDEPALTDAAAAAIEFLHCASLAHDDLPCFDNAELRRGRPSLHAAFGERIAVLAGDALIVLAFNVADAPPAHPRPLSGDDLLALFKSDAAGRDAAMIPATIEDMCGGAIAPKRTLEVIYDAA